MVGLLQVLAGFIDCALGVVVGLDCLTILIDGAVALAGHVEDFSELDMSPDFGPAWVSVAAKSVAVGVGASLVIALREEDFADAVVGERALRVCVKGLLEFPERTGQIALRDQLLAFENGYSDLQVRGRFQKPVIRIDGDMARPAKGIHDELGVGADDVDFFHLGFSVGFHAKFDRHTEKIQILLHLTDGTEAFIVTEPIDRIFIHERGCACSIDPLRKEGRELLLALCRGYLFKIARTNPLVGVLAQCACEHLLEYLVAEFPAHHVKDHGAFFKCHGLELWREWA